MKRKLFSNTVAKHAHKFNHAKVYEDRKKAIKRGKRKHKNQPYQIAA